MNLVLSGSVPHGVHDDADHEKHVSHMHHQYLLFEEALVGKQQLLL
jgi:hypothetical protein